jgi:hypothetical protein
MTVRTTSRMVTFTHPFNLSGVDEVQPAGTYTVETDEELLQALSVPAYRRISTLMRLPARPTSPMLTQIVEITTVELAAVLARDAQPNETTPQLTETVSCVGKTLPAGWESSVKDGNIGLPSTPLI